MKKLKYRWQVYFWFYTFALLSIGSCVGGGVVVDSRRYGLGGSLLALAVVFLVFMVGVVASADKESQ